MDRRADGDQCTSAGHGAAGWPGANWPGIGTAMLFLVVGIGLLVLAFGGFGRAVNGGTVAGGFGIASVGCGIKVAADTLRRWREAVALNVLGRRGDVD